MCGLRTRRQFTSQPKTSFLSGIADPVGWGACRDDLRGAFRHIGMVSGGTVYGGRVNPGAPVGTTPLVMNDVPSLQAHTQVFIKVIWGSLA